MKPKQKQDDGSRFRQNKQAARPFVLEKKAHTVYTSLWRLNWPQSSWQPCKSEKTSIKNGFWYDQIGHNYYVGVLYSQSSTQQLIIG